MLKWYAPLDGQELTDLALHYIFEAGPGAENYTLMAARSAEDLVPGRAAAEYLIPQIPGCGEAFFLPADDELLPEGGWYLKAVSDKGAETGILRISVNTAHTKAPLRRPISPENPLISIHDMSKHRFGAEYDVLPEDLKPYFSISGHLSFRRQRETFLTDFEELDRSGYPWSYTAIFHGQIVDNHYIVPALPYLEHILQHAKHLTHVEGVEMYMGVRPDDDWQITLYNRIIQLCGKYGCYFMHTDGNRNDIDLPAITKRPIYMDNLREYADYVVMSYKQNHSNASYSCYGAILGALIDGAVKNIGIQAENWYWNDAGFCDDIGVYHGYLQGNEQQIPAVFSAQMLLPGLSLGACYYALEGEGWLIRMRGTDEYELSPQGISVLSMLRTVIRSKLIPSRDDVLSRIHAAVDMQGLAPDWGDAWEGGIMRTAFQNLYGIVHTKELFPKQLRYFYLPVVTDRRESFEHLKIVDLEDIHTPDEMNEALNPVYPAWFGGDAYVTRSGGTYVIMNSRENTDESQYFSVPVGAGGTVSSVASAPVAPVISVEGSVGLWQYLLLWNGNGVTRVHANARKGSSLTFFLRTAEGTAPAVVTEGDGIEWRTDLSADGCAAASTPGSPVIRVTVTGSDSPVELAVVDMNAVDDASSLADIDLPMALANRPFDEDFLSDHIPSGLSGKAKGVPVIDACANLMYGRLPISMNSLRYPHGISMPRGSAISFALDEKYKKLTMTVGFDIDVWMPIIVNHTDIVWDRYEKDIDVVLKIYAAYGGKTENAGGAETSVQAAAPADGTPPAGSPVLLYESPHLTSTYYREPLTLDVTGVREITFTMDGEIHQKPLWCAITGTPDRYLFDASGRDDIPPAEVYIDLGNPVLTLR